VQYKDGSVLAQMGNPDMRTPIAHCLAYPNRIDAGVEPLDFKSLASFTFGKPDAQRYPNLYLAMQAEHAGQSATTALNAANEIAVQAFLEGHIGFTHIHWVNEETMNRIEPSRVSSLQQVLDIDSKARDEAKKIVEEINQRV
jgi:1-deoxy-D-xylulose-5-phosphate reductoisomerase